MKQRGILGVGEKGGSTDAVTFAGGIVRRWVEEAVTEILMLSEWLEALSLSPLSLTAASPCGPTAAFCGEGTTVAGLLLNSPAVCLGVTDSP